MEAAGWRPEGTGYARERQSPDWLYEKHGELLSHHGEGPQTRNYAFGNPGTEDTEMGDRRLTLMNTAPCFAQNDSSLTLPRHARKPAHKGGSGA
jgi:hypothetical protein